MINLVYEQLQIIDIELGDKGEVNQETGTDIYTLLHMKQITNKGLLYRTGHSMQCSVVPIGKTI